ncbi:hypothetical protein CesoFtcFv8_000802 [Champsocephalus esox]|uniref:Globoside alpha-1,3-N-acetylgalactosaminyltransferase 1-like n=1 Tax=Champsocephalus esox TaxID=159716 RepID=A0AAN8D261_9TELE|nr:hypothetical protein CesoFtcFv8_000802 [Champsocephalus esox]
MWCNISRIHILVACLIFLGGNAWRIRDLKMQTGLKYAQPSTLKGPTDVNAVTNWNAPLVWEGTFDPVVIDAIYKKMDPRVAVLVFAVGKYTSFLKGFLESAEKYFLIDFRVTYYIFTDNEKEVPKIKLARGRNIAVVPIPGAGVLGRMKWATITIDNQIRKETDYLYMMDIDSVFHNSRISQSTVCCSSPWLLQEHIEGRDVYKLVRYCYKQSEEDAKNKIEAIWQEESHLNKYLLYNKPTKVLSPEYLWSDYDGIPEDIQVVRISQLIYAEEMVDIDVKSLTFKE